MSLPTDYWIPSGSYQEILYHKSAEGIAKITINRPHVRNAFTPLTVREMQKALDDARDDINIGTIILTGQGDLAFAPVEIKKSVGMPAIRIRTPDTYASMSLIFNARLEPALNLSWRWLLVMPSEAVMSCT